MWNIDNLQWILEIAILCVVVAILICILIYAPKILKMNPLRWQPSSPLPDRPTQRIKAVSPRDNPEFNGVLHQAQRRLGHARDISNAGVSRPLPPLTDQIQRVRANRLIPLQTTNNEPDCSHPL